MHLRYTRPLDLPRIAPEQLGSASAASVLVEEPGSDRLFERYAPSFLDDPAGTGMFTGLGQQTYTSPPVFVTEIPNATLFGYRELAWADCFTTDEEWPHAALHSQFLQNLASPEFFPNEDTRLRGTSEAGVYDLQPDGRAARRINTTAVVLCSHEPSNYGSFLFRVLPKLHAVRKLGLGQRPIAVWAHTPSFRDLLGMAGIPAEQIIQHDTHALTTFDRVIAPSLRNPHGFLDPESHGFFQDLLQQLPEAGTGRRLYISRQGQMRRGASSRQMLNEAELIGALGRLDFEIVEPEALSPVEQARIFASAAIVVGPSGSAMFNVVFCRPGTKIVDIESEPHWIYAHAGLFASCKTDYGIFVGEVDGSDPTPVHRRFSVDIPALVARVGHFMRQ